VRQKELKIEELKIERSCTLCGRTYVYDRNKGHQPTKCNSCSANANLDKVKLKALIYKGNKCQVCGYAKSPKALVFHHENPKIKDFSMSENWSRSWSVLKTELDKCILVCANCHGEIHEGITPCPKIIIQ
jgi:hypothetical protein